MKSDHRGAFVALATSAERGQTTEDRQFLAWFDTTTPLAVPGRAGMEARILDAARRVFLRYGPAKVSVQDVALEAGVSRGSVYKYYENRDKLIGSVKEFAEVVFADDLDRAMAMGANFEDQVLQAAFLFQEYLRIRPNPPGHSEFVALELTLYSGPFVELISTVVRRYLEVARARGEVRRDLPIDWGAEWIARILISFVNNPAQAFDDTDPAELESFVRAFAVRGLD